jgi:hypothetical protein
MYEYDSYILNGLNGRRRGNNEMKEESEEGKER